MCTSGNSAGLVWAIVVGFITLLIGWAMISSKVKAYRKRRNRENTVPITDQNLRRGGRYNVFLANGTSYLDVEILGTTDAESGQFSLGAYDGMLVLQRADSKKVFVKQSFVRFIEET
jgi:hypothetical protein